MARVDGSRGVLARIATRVSRVGGKDLPQPALLAHSRRLLFGVAVLDGQVRATRALDAKLKQLALLKVSTQVGCPN